jgi:hypothetical protein
MLNLGVAGCSKLLPGRFTARNEYRHPLCGRLGWPQSRTGRAWEVSSPLGFETRIFQSVASRYATCAIPAHCRRRYCLLNQHLKKLHTRFLLYNDFKWYRGSNELYKVMNFQIFWCLKRGINNLLKMFWHANEIFTDKKGTVFKRHISEERN